MVKRIFLFVLTNILIFVTISLVLNILGVRPYMTAAGIDYSQLLVFCLVWGMTGSLISLALSRVMAKWMLGVQVLKPGQAGELEWLVEMVSQIARSAGLPKAPEVGVYNSPETNAFATGPTKSRALVAFSSGILRQMDREQIRGVAGHEIAHIANGDMVTMMLLQGVVNAFVMFLARVIAFVISQNVKEESRYWVHFLTVFVLDILLSILGSLVVMWFSRQREFRADAGSARYVGRAPMISALEALKRGQMLPEAHRSLATMKISGKTKGWLHLFASHPPLEERIAKLESYTR